MATVPIQQIELLRLEELAKLGLELAETIIRFTEEDASERPITGPQTARLLHVYSLASTLREKAGVK
jgi:hypothetical protein